MAPICSCVAFRKCSNKNTEPGSVIVFVTF
ncbi:hypothetical protein COLO4_33058 [Corchorus olitorius]|uniref:Uncharacterized protein n=1 Tax=Corchorus olitorius TaxID=93759 RepID=A0A1R3GWJ3_9ROSI|nr:hypothetical protein COLO4_33058 [Corchorus olitorius]